MSAATRLLVALSLAGSAAACSSDDDGSSAADTATTAPDSQPTTGEDATTEPPDVEPDVVGVTPAPPGEPWATLAEWNLFADAVKQVPAEGVVRFDIISPLFTDYAAKHRFIWLPEDEQIGYRDDGIWDLPVGAIVVKTFAYPVDARDPGLGEHILETRLLVHEPDGWVPHTYVWDDAQTEAVRKVAGVFIDNSWIDADGNTREHLYVVPTTVECQGCHGDWPDTRLLGVKTDQLDHEGTGESNQIDAMASLGLFSETPTPASERRSFAPPDDAGVDVALRARAYLDANCSHCHSALGPIEGKTLFLDFDSTDPETNPPVNWGVCKIPTSAGSATCGYTYDVVPGEPDQSVMICRMKSTEADKLMPPLGRGLAHEEGIALISAWIEQLEPANCGGSSE